MEKLTLRQRFAAGIDWKILSIFVVVHVVAVTLALYTFTWPGFVTCVVLIVATGMGVTLGYHRCLTHGSFKTYAWMRRLLAVFGLLSGEGPPLFWVAFHRKHHKHSDQPGLDPHSPTEGSWWAHILWMLPRRETSELSVLIRKYASDLYKDRFIRSLNPTYFLWHLGLIAALAILGYCYNGWFGAGSLVVWGYFLRMLYVLHATWAVNSATHLWGYRTYDTSDNSRNLWWVGLLAFGEGWHNNHHGDQLSARHGMRWWEVDVTYYAIWFGEKIGLFWDVHRPKPTA